jgi:hypothetical protein
MKAKEAIGKECLACNHIGGIYSEYSDGCECMCHGPEEYEE